MSRSPLGWSLPPGVTDRMIDEAAGAFDDDGSYPPPCPGRKDHSWVVADKDNGGDGRCYCEYCGADGDA
jgi:hypothetical protein